MAIQFIQDIEENVNLMAYNNNVIRYYSDETEKTVLTSQIYFNGRVITIYPLPDGSFYFNFKEYATVAVNTNNFIDDVNPELDAEDDGSFSYTGNGFYSENVFIEISFSDITTEDTTRNITFLAGVEQLTSYKKHQTQQEDNIILSPLAPNTNNTYYVKYWEGYPFDVSFLQLTYPDEPTSTIQLNNLTNLLDYPFPAANKNTRLFFCDGNQDESIDNFLPISLGQNVIQWYDRYLIVDKQDVCSGVYLKWFNNYGGYSYWKFDNIFKQVLNTKTLGEIVTDFDNIADTFSQTSELGKTAGEKIQVNTDALTDNEFSLLFPLLFSPKVYLFVGEPFARASVTDWVEVKLTSQQYTTRNYKQQPVKLSFDIELPDLYTQTL